MAQPVFLKNFKIDGFNLGDMFVVANVTIPFLNVERSYYTVGNSDGSNLLSTRLGSNTITIDGFLIPDFSGMSVSETKDKLVGQIMGKDVKELIFDEMPDRYFNVVFEGSEDYDASTSELTALTLTFTCPDGVAHSVKNDVFRNTQSTSANMIIDSEFENLQMWNEEAYVLPDKINGSNALRLNNSDKELSTMEQVENNLISDDVYYRLDDLTTGSQIRTSLNYAVVKEPTFEGDEITSLAVRLEEFDTENGKLLNQTTAPISNNGNVQTAYAFDATGKDRFTTSYPNENILLGTTSETQSFTTNTGWPDKTGATNALMAVGDNRVVKAGDTITYSAYITAPADVRAYIYVRLSRPGAPNGSYEDKASNLLEPGTSGWCSVTVTIPSDTTSIRFTVGRYEYNNTVTRTISWASEKAEKSDKQTIWTEANQGITDNTTPKYIGFSTTDNDSPSNLLLNGALRSNYDSWSGDPTFTRSSNGEYTTLTKTTSNAGTSLGLNGGTSYSLNGAVSSNSEYTLSGSVYIDSTNLTNLTSLQLRLFITYSNNTSQQIIAGAQLDKRNQWQQLVVSGLTTNLPISAVRVQLVLNGTFTGTIRVRDIKLENGAVATPFAPHVTERGALYTWYPYGTSIPNSMFSLSAFTNTFTISSDETKVIKLSILAYGNSDVVISKPMLTTTSSGTYVASAKQIKTQFDIINNGTWDSYPIIEATPNSDQALLGIINDDGDILQFGNNGDVTNAEPKSNEVGFYNSWAANTLPSNSQVNTGHVTNSPYNAGDTSKPNTILGTVRFKGGLIKPDFPETFSPGAWSGPTIATNIAAPSTGGRSGAFSYNERLTFKTDKGDMGQCEMVVISDANDIIMGTVVQDNSNASVENIVEFWLGNVKVNAKYMDSSKNKTGDLSVTMTRDSTGRVFTWTVEVIDYKNPTKPLSKYTFTYNNPTAITKNAVRTSRWFRKYNRGKGMETVVTGTKYYFTASRETVNIRNQPNLKGRILGQVKKGTRFTTMTWTTGQNLAGNDQWYQVYKSGANITATGWVSGAELNQTNKTYNTKSVVAWKITDMEIIDSSFTWLGDSNPNDTLNPFKKGDKIIIDTYNKSIAVNGENREDLAAIGNQWSGFKLTPGNHTFKVVSSSWQTNDFEVVVLNQRHLL